MTEAFSRPISTDPDVMIIPYTPGWKGCRCLDIIFNTVYRLPGVTYAELPNFMLPELLCRD